MSRKRGGEMGRGRGEEGKCTSLHTLASGTAE